MWNFSLSSPEGAEFLWMSQKLWVSCDRAALCLFVCVRWEVWRRSGSVLQSRPWRATCWTDAKAFCLFKDSSLQAKTSHHLTHLISPLCVSNDWFLSFSCSLIFLCYLSALFFSQHISISHLWDLIFHSHLLPPFSSVSQVFFSPHVPVFLSNRSCSVFYNVSSTSNCSSCGNIDRRGSTNGYCSYISSINDIQRNKNSNSCSRSISRHAISSSFTILELAVFVIAKQVEVLVAAGY